MKKKIFTFCSVFLLFSTTVALAYPSYASSPTNPGVNCANCHSDRRSHPQSHPQSHRRSPPQFLLTWV